MNAEQFKGQWQQLKGKVKVTWGKLTDDDLLKIDGRMDQLAGKIQERYGITKEEAKRKLDAFTKDLETAGDVGRKAAAASPATKHEQTKHEQTKHEQKPAAEHERSEGAE